MADPAQKPATYADLEAVPDHLVAEILFGSLVTHPRPAPPHSVASNALAYELTGPFQKGRGGPGGWVFMTEPGLYLGPHVIVPDLAGWRRERMPRLPPKARVEIAPDWACEVISRSTEAYDKGPKRRICATYGVKHLWHVNPTSKILEVFELRDGQWLLVEAFEGADSVKAPPFLEAEFQLCDLWPLEVAADDDAPEQND
jgi:Uma2 family endonuclease